MVQESKNHFFSENDKLVATTYAGLEQVLADELKELDAKKIQVSRRAVYFAGNLEMVYRANYSLRTALRILLPIREFKIFKADDLYYQASKIKWENYFSTDKTFAIQSTVFSEQFKNSMYASLKLKDAIVDRFRKTQNLRPSVRVNQPDVLINLHIANNLCKISLDSSGESLHKRGYRTGNHEAPLSEVLAAGMIKLSGWKNNESLFDPMCGSGTIVIEAAMMAKNIKPGEIGRKYAFQNWKNFNQSIFEKVKNENTHYKVNFAIYGSDISRTSIDLAFRNAEKVNVNDIIKFEIKDFKTTTRKDDCTFILFNPPYGKRIKAGDTEFYSMVGERLKHEYPGYKVWVISTNECLKSIGLRPTKKIPLFNGALPCSFRKYELYTGSKK